MTTKMAAAMLFIGATFASSGAFAFEGKKSADFSLVYGTEAFNNLEGQFGARAGFGYEFLKNVQARVEISYLRSSTDMSGMNVTGTRVPIDVGIRQYYPLPRIDTDLAAFGQASLEVSFDDWHPDADSPSRGRTAIGGVIGAGAEYLLDRNWGAVANVQYHIIQDSFFSTGIGLAYHF